MLCRAALLLLITALGWTQDRLPDAPQAQPAAVRKCGPWNCWDYSHPQLTWKQTFQSKSFYIPAAVWVAGWAYDAELTHEGLAHHHCTEANRDLPLYPSRGQLYAEFARHEAPLLAMGYFIVKLKRKPTKAIFYGMSAAATTIHVRSGSKWVWGYNGGCW